MKIRGKREAGKIELQMAAMIDVVFQLLIFFMLTLKIVEAEGDFNINMPIGAPSQANPEQTFPDIKVKLQADADGNLAQLVLGQRVLGSGPSAFQRLNSEILKMIGRPGNPLTKDMEVELDADYNLHYQYIIAAVSACTGRLGPEGNIVRYIEKIKFAPPKRPADAG